MANKLTIIREEKPAEAQWYEDVLESQQDYSEGPRTNGLHPHVINDTLNIDPSWPTTEEVQALGAELVISTAEDWGVEKEVHIRHTDADPVIFSDPEHELFTARKAHNTEHGITLTVSTVDANEDWTVA